MFEGKKVFIAEDNADLRIEICKFLTLQGFSVYPAESIESFKKNLEKFSPDVALIDKNLGAEDGYVLIDFIRNHSQISQIPIIVVTGQGELDNRVAALSLGADDFLEKPFRFQELEHRLYAGLRRAGSYHANPELIKFDDVKVDVRNHELFIDDQKILLTKTEYNILLELVSKRGELVTRERLVHRALTTNNSSPRTLDVHINSLRKKLGEKNSKNIRAIRGRGYCFKSA